MVFLFSCYRTRVTKKLLQRNSCRIVPLPVQYSNGKSFWENIKCCITSCSIFNDLVFMYHTLHVISAHSHFPIFCLIFTFWLCLSLWWMFLHFPFDKVIAITMLNKHTSQNWGIGTLKINSKSNYMSDFEITLDYNRKWQIRNISDESNLRFVLLCVIV